MRIKTKQEVARLGVVFLAVLLTAPASVAGQDQTDERSPHACWHSSPLPAACAAFFPWEAPAWGGMFRMGLHAPSPLTGTSARDRRSVRDYVTVEIGAGAFRTHGNSEWRERLHGATPDVRLNLSERGGWWVNRLSVVPGKSMSFPSQPVASRLRQNSNSGSILPELLSLGGGAAGSWLVGVPVFYALNQTAGDRRVKGDAGYSRTAHWGMLVSTSIGAAAGVHLVRRGLGETASMKGALAGSLLGTLPLVFGVDSPYLPYFAFTVGSLLQAAGGLIGSR